MVTTRGPMRMKRKALTGCRVPTWWSISWCLSCELDRCLLQNTVKKSEKDLLGCNYIQVETKLVWFYSHRVALLLLTGIFEVRRNSSRASSDPRVEACTYTPRSDSLMDWSVSRRMFDTSSCWEAEYRKLWSTMKKKQPTCLLSSLLTLGQYFD